MKGKTITDALAKSLKQIMKAWKKDSKTAVYKAEYVIAERIIELYKNGGY